MKFKNRTELTRWVLEARFLWLFLDYDGTLADFAPTPDHIEPDFRVIRVLERLVRLPSVHVAVVSGRSLHHLRRLLPVSGMHLAGTYGAELLTPSGEIVHVIDFRRIRPFLETILPRWGDLIAGRTGFFLEDKYWSLALHARFAEEIEAQQVLDLARQAVDANPLDDQFRIMGGHKFLEIAPRAANKRATVSHLLDRYPLPDGRLVYIGDDDKDEEAFSVIHAGDGAAIKVFQASQASCPTEADLVFESPTETLQWLEEYIDSSPPG